MKDYKSLIILAQNNDEKAKEKLVNDNIFLVWSLVHRFNNSTYDKEELLNLCTKDQTRNILSLTSFSLAFSSLFWALTIKDLKSFIYLPLTLKIFLIISLVPLSFFDFINKSSDNDLIIVSPNPLLFLLE